MNRQEEFRRVIDLGISVVNQGTAVACRVARKVSTEAARQAKIAQPVIADACRNARLEVQHQVELAKPVLQRSVRDGASALRTISQRTYSAARTVLNRTPRRIAVGIAIGLSGMTVFALTLSPKSAPKSLVVHSSPVSLPPDAESVAEVELEMQPDVEPTGTAPVSLQNLVRDVAASGVDLAQLQRQQREQELVQRRQQAQFELEQAEADFQLAEVVVTRNLFAAILDRIARLAIPPPLVT